MVWHSTEYCLVIQSTARVTGSMASPGGGLPLTGFSQLTTLSLLPSQHQGTRRYTSDHYSILYIIIVSTDTIPIL